MAWLYGQVFDNPDERKPHFSEQSALNWLRALRFEVDREYGHEVAMQFAASRRIIRAQPKVQGAALPSGQVLEPLFGAMTNTMALLRLNHFGCEVPWLRPGAAVTWYYAIYAAVRAILATVGQAPADNHGAAMNAYASVLQTRMPHPFNMLARHVKDEEYFSQLPNMPATARYDIKLSFETTAEAAQGMLLQYLSGTADWYTGRTKDKLRRRHKIERFSTKEAKALRNKALDKTVAFMHCAFRYRGKANYRDHIYLTYGARELTTAPKYVEDLAVTSRFFFLVAAAYVEWHLGQQLLRTFFHDARANLRRAELALPEELFWSTLDL